VPEEISLEQAAAVLLQGMTAHYLALSTYPLKAGETCLVHAAAGGVGQLLVQIAKKRGARVIATVSNEEKAGLARQVERRGDLVHRAGFLKRRQNTDWRQGVEGVTFGRKTTFLKVHLQAAA
jgi:NADPH2:quinone reductase